MSAAIPLTGTASSGNNRVHVLLSVQSLVVLLVTFNRLGTRTLGYVAPNQFLRWVDFHNMLPLPLLSLVAFYLLKNHLEISNARSASLANGSARLALSVAFIAGAYLLGAGYGDHEVTNYLHARFCASDTASDLCRIVIFNDDEFSHWVFFAGFVLVNASLMLWQALYPAVEGIKTRDAALVLMNAIFIAAGIFANLAFEPIGLDLYIVALLAGVSLYLLRRRGAQPLLVYYSAAYCIGLAATVAYRALASGPA
jgi:hypothetical protein